MYFTPQDKNGNNLAKTTGSTESDAAVTTSNTVEYGAETEAKGTERKKSKKKKADLSPEEVAEKKKRRSYRLKIVLGLFGPFALQALDVTIIASAFSYIAADFNEIKQLNWIISAFNLTSAAFLPFWAQITDVFGRYLTVQAAIIILMIGSAICTGAPISAFGVLLLGRALQGIGAAGVNISIHTILADRVSLSDYALNWTIFTLVSGVSFNIGPVVGGYLTQTSWRWCFAINLPIAVISLFLVWFLLRKELLGPKPLQELEGNNISTRQGRLFVRLSIIDYGGQALFLLGLGLLCLALTWGGGTYSWKSPAVLVPLAVGSILSIGWILYEHFMAPESLISRIFPRQRAMMPWELLSQRDIGLLFIINFAIGMSMFAVFYFADLYFVLVEKRSSSDAGLALLFYLPGASIGAFMAMFSSNVWPRQTLPALLLGAITSAVGITGLAWAVHAKNTAMVYLMIAIVGHSVLMRLNPASLHGLAYFPTMTASIICLGSFAMPFGGLVGLTIMSTVFTNKSGPGQHDPKNGIKWAFIVIAPFMWLCILLTTFLGNVWISKDGGHEVVNGAFLWSFVTRKKLSRKRIHRADGGGLESLVPLTVERKGGNDVEAGLTHAATTSAQNDEAKNIVIAPS